MESLERPSRPLDALVHQERPPLVAVLPQNSAEYAIRAEESGADAVMVGIEKTEAAFPGLFAGFDLQEERVSEVLSAVSVPVGISIGDARPVSRDTWERILAKNFSFVNMYAHHMPLFALEDARVEKLVSIGAGYMLEQVKSISEMQQVCAIEAAIVSPQGKSYPFSLLDISTVRLITRLSSKPVFLRMQKRMGFDDLNSVWTTGIAGVTLDPSVLEPGIEAYRDAISSFRPRGNGADHSNR